MDKLGLTEVAVGAMILAILMLIHEWLFYTYVPTSGGLGFIAAVGETILAAEAFTFGVIALACGVSALGEEGPPSSQFVDAVGLIGGASSVAIGGADIYSLYLTW